MCWCWTQVHIWAGSKGQTGLLPRRCLCCNVPVCRVHATSSVRTQLFGLYAQGHVQYTISTNSTFIKISKIDWKWKLFNLFRPEFRPAALREACMGTWVWWSGRCSPEWRPNYIFQPGDLPHQAPRGSHPKLTRARCRIFRIDGRSCMS